MKKNKNDLKQKQVEVEKVNFDEAAKLDVYHSKNKNIILDDYENDYISTEKGYQEKLSKMK